MTKSQKKAMRAPKGQRKKLKKQPLQFEDLEPEDDLLKLDFDLDAGGFEKELFKKLKKQRKEIMEYLESAGYAIEETGGKGRPISFRVGTLEMEGEAPQP